MDRHSRLFIERKARKHEVLLVKRGKVGVSLQEVSRSQNSLISLDLMVASFVFVILLEIFQCFSRFGAVFIALSNSDKVR